MADPNTESIVMTMGQPLVVAYIYVLSCMVEVVLVSTNSLPASHQNRMDGSGDVPLSDKTSPAQTTAADDNLSKLQELKPGYVESMDLDTGGGDDTGSYRLEDGYIIHTVKEEDSDVIPDIYNTPSSISSNTKFEATSTEPPTTAFPITETPPSTTTVKTTTDPFPNTDTISDETSSNISSHPTGILPTVTNVSGSGPRKKGPSRDWDPRIHSGAITGTLGRTVFRSDEERLLDYLFTEYNPSARPVINSGKSVQVSMQFSLMHFQELVSIYCLYNFTYLFNA